MPPQNGPGWRRWPALGDTSCDCPTVAAARRFPSGPDSSHLALADAAVLTGVPLDGSSLVDSDVVSWTSALPRPQPGHRAAMDRLRQQVDQRPGLHLTGSMVAGTGLAAVVADARIVAKRILEQG